ncbi:hypothetical protein B6D29_02700 [Microgenomates bacterium UTCPR1]|nr:MAG: hypothetical protein B6D29_02700 [Microgenomates bacterium UTCPR1]
MRLFNLKKIPFSIAHNDTRRKSILKVGQSLSDMQTINYVFMKHGQTMVKHRHSDCEEFYIFLKGKGTMKISDSTIPVSKNTSILITPGEVHSIENITTESLEFITIRVLIKKSQAPSTMGK